LPRREWIVSSRRPAMPADLFRHGGDRPIMGFTLEKSSY
jgi:hypothetical protein